MQNFIIQLVNEHDNIIEQFDAPSNPFKVDDVLSINVKTEGGHWNVKPYIGRFRVTNIHYCLDVNYNHPHKRNTDSAITDKFTVCVSLRTESITNMS